jgi:hypothetical protein
MLAKRLITMVDDLCGFWVRDGFNITVSSVIKKSLQVHPLTDLPEEVATANSLGDHFAGWIFVLESKFFVQMKRGRD